MRPDQPLPIETGARTSSRQFVNTRCRPLYEPRPVKSREATLQFQKPYGFLVIRSRPSEQHKLSDELESGWSRPHRSPDSIQEQGLDGPVRHVQRNPVHMRTRTLRAALVSASSTIPLRP